MIERISIELSSWEDAPFPICTKDVNLIQAEKDLYASMIQHGYTNEQIEEYLKFDYADDESDKFYYYLWTEEEKAIMNNGGVYYENL